MLNAVSRLLIWVAVVVSALSGAAAWAATLDIDTGDRRQSIDGFGASGAWWVRWFDELPPATQERALRLLFTDDGAGLDIYRYNIPAGSGERVTIPARRTPDIETAPFAYDFGRDEAGISVARRVRALGVTRFVAFSNSPPARLTQTGTPSGGEEGGSNLRRGSEPAFARYLLDVCEHLLDELDLEEIRLSPLNEPQWDWGRERRIQEGCFYTPRQAADLIRAVLDEVDERGAAVSIEAPESGSWDTSRPYAEALFGDETIGPRLHGFAMHSYWSDAEDKRRFAAWFGRRFPGVPIQMSEYCEMRRELDLTMRSGLHVARVLHEDFVIGGVTEWQWWLCLSPVRFCDGLIQVDRRAGTIATSKRLWVIAQWSRFLEPGSVRLGASSDDGGLLASAYLSADGASVVCVAVNPGDEAAPLELRVDGEAGAIAAVYVTDDGHDLQRADALIGPGGVVAAPPRSVVTAVVELDGRP